MMFFFRRPLILVACLGFASLAQAQSSSASTVSTANGAGSPATAATDTKLVIMTGPGAEEASAKPVSTKPCPIPTGTRFRPTRDDKGQCPGVSEAETDMTTEGHIGTWGMSAGTISGN